MPDNRLDLRAVKALPVTCNDLRDELGLLIESDDIEDLTFEYRPEEVGLYASFAKLARQRYVGAYVLRPRMEGRQT